MSYDRAVEAAAAALLAGYREGRLSAHSADCVEDARIAVTAAAPHLAHQHVTADEGTSYCPLAEEAGKRAERAEAEAADLRQGYLKLETEVDWWKKRYHESQDNWTLIDMGNRALADELAGALAHYACGTDGRGLCCEAHAALARWKEART